MTAEPSGGPRPRSPIPKRLRFEVFKRDRFACVYCGGTPPSSVLQLDHVEPHSAGGADDETNLVTACVDCNAGKSNRPLGEVRPRIAAAAADEMQERLDQLRAYRAWRTEFDEELRAELDTVWEAWIAAFGGYEDEGSFHSPRMDWPDAKSVMGFMLELPMPRIEEAVRIAAWKWRKEGLSRSSVIRYFYGTMRGMVKRAEEERQLLSVTWEALVERVPMLVTIRDDLVRFDPADPWHVCGERIWTDGWWETSTDGGQRLVPGPMERILDLVGPRSDYRADPVLGSHTARDLALRTIKGDLPLCGQVCDCGRPKRPVREEDYPRCRRCGQVTAPVDRRESCIAVPIEQDGTWFDPVRFGMEASLLRCEIAEKWTRYRRLAERVSPTIPVRCPQCRTPQGGYHHPGCSSAACPICGSGPGCDRRGHRAEPMGVSVKQAMARLHMMGPRKQADT